MDLTLVIEEIWNLEKRLSYFSYLKVFGFKYMQYTLFVEDSFHWIISSKTLIWIDYQLIRVNL